jgi:predicted nucleotidyltransferase
MATSLDQSLIDEIVRRIVEVANPDRIILFGSYARGETQKGSDIDLLVVKREVASRRQEVMRIRDVLVPLGISFDLLVTSSTDYEKWSEAPSTTLYWVKREGEVLYEAAA